MKKSQSAGGRRKRRRKKAKVDWLAEAKEGLYGLLTSPYARIRTFPIDLLIELHLESCLLFGRALRSFSFAKVYTPRKVEFKHRKYGSHTLVMTRALSSRASSYGSLMIDDTSIFVDRIMRRFIDARCSNSILSVPDLQKNRMLDRHIICLDEDEWCKLSRVMIGPAAALGYLLNEHARQEIGVTGIVQLTLRFPQLSAARLTPPLLKFGRSPYFACFGSFRPEEDSELTNEEIAELAVEFIDEVDAALLDLALDPDLNQIDTMYSSGQPLSVIEEFRCRFIEEELS